MEICGFHRNLLKTTPFSLIIESRIAKKVNIAEQTPSIQPYFMKDRNMWNEQLFLERA